MGKWNAVQLKAVTPVQQRRSKMYPFIHYITILHYIAVIQNYPQSCNNHGWAQPHMQPVLSPILYKTVLFILLTSHLKVYDFCHFKQLSGFRSKMLSWTNLRPLLQNRKTKMSSKLRTTMDSQEYWETFKRRSFQWKVIINIFFPLRTIILLQKSTLSSWCAPAIATWNVFTCRLQSGSGRKLD